MRNPAKCSTTMLWSLPKSSGRDQNGEKRIETTRKTDNNKRKFTIKLFCRLRDSTAGLI